MTPSAASRSRASENGIACSSVAVQRDEVGGIEFATPISRSHAGSKRFGKLVHGTAPPTTFSDVPISTASDATAIGSMPASRRLAIDSAPVRFDSPSPVGGRQQIVVAEVRRLGAERLEQRDLHAGVGDVVVAADDMGDAHVDVVDDRRQRIEIGAVLAHKDRIGQRGEVDGLFAAHQIGPVDFGAFGLQRIAGEVRQQEAPVRLAAFGFDIPPSRAASAVSASRP